MYSSDDLGYLNVKHPRMQPYHMQIYRKDCDWTLIFHEKKRRRDTDPEQHVGITVVKKESHASISTFLQLQEYRSVFPLSTTQNEKPRILVTSDTDTFRKLARTQVATSHVLEIGCSTGGTSAILWTLANVTAWIGFDTSAEMVETVQEKLKSCHHHKKQNRKCVQIDPLLDPQLAAVMVHSFCKSNVDTAHFPTDETCNPLTVILDIGGNRAETAVILMLQWILSTFSNSCRQIIIKSRSIHAALLRLSEHQEEQDVNQWFQRQQILAMRASIPKHPLQAAKKFALDHLDDPQGGRRLICRYHNYHRQGCKKFKDKATVCPFDHEHCHLCCQLGHIARECPCIQADTSTNVKI